MDLLERLLSDLGSVATSDSDGLVAEATLEPLAIAEHVFTLVASEDESLSASERARQLYLILSSSAPPSLLQFLSLTERVKDKEIIKTKAYLLKKLGELVKHFSPADISPYGDMILQLCLGLFRREDSSEVRVAAMSPIKNLLRRSELNMELMYFVDESSMLESTVENLLDVSREKKTSKTLIGEVMKVLGLIVNAYPEVDIRMIMFSID